MNIENLRRFFGWCTVINFGLYLISVIPLLFIAEWASEIHAGMFQVDAASTRQAYFTYLANYKLAIVVLNFVPYVALRVMTRGKPE